MLRLRWKLTFALSLCATFATASLEGCGSDAGTPSNPSKVETTEVHEEGVIGKLFTPASGNHTKHPTVLLVGGSEGGIPGDAVAAPFAESGYTTLAIAYFGVDGLPPQLSAVPLETITHAIAWLSKRSTVDASPIVMVGFSKGAELALLAASTFADIKGVIAYAPSSVVWQSVPASSSGAPPSTSSWAFQGQELSYVPYRITQEFLDHAASGRSLRLDLLYEPSLEQTDRVEASSIAVEKVQGPVLLLSGGDDHLWPSSSMAAQVIHRLRTKGHPYSDGHIDYPHAGHRVGQNVGRRAKPDGGQAASLDLGGSDEANQASYDDSWPAVVRFLDQVR